MNYDSWIVLKLGLNISGFPKALSTTGLEKIIASDHRNCMFVSMLVHLGLPDPSLCVRIPLVDGVHVVVVRRPSADIEGATNGGTCQVILS